MGNALNRSIVVTLKNKSGGSVAKGDVVVVDSTTGEAFTVSSTIGLSTDTIGVVIDPNGIANNENGLIAIGGTVPQINLISGSALGDTFGISSTPKYAIPHAIINVGDFGQVLGTGTTPAALLWGMPSQAGITGTSTATTIGNDGWVPATDTWIAGAADAPSYTYSIAANVTGTYGLGQRIKFTQTSVRMGIITKVDYSAPNTNITFYGGTDYTMATGTSITNPYYSLMKAPVGFPLSPTKWTVQTIYGNDASQSTPTQNTWYNLVTGSISIPIGIWDTYYETTPGFLDASSTNWQTRVTLSTANNTESDTSWSALVDGSAVVRGFVTLFRRGIIEVTTKTTYYLNFKTNISGLDTLYVANTSSPQVIRAICAYL